MTQEKKGACAIAVRRQIVSAMMMKKNKDNSFPFFLPFKKAMELFVTYMSDHKYVKGT